MLTLSQTKADDDDEDFVLNSDEEEDSEDEDGDMVEVPMDLAIDEYELQDDDGNITICKLAPEEIVDNLFDPKRIADIQALPGFEENTIRGRVRQIAVIKRAVSPQIRAEATRTLLRPNDRKQT
jgi:hypothetical protein